MTQNQKYDGVGTLAVKSLVARRAREWVQRKQEEKERHELQRREWERKEREWREVQEEQVRQEQERQKQKEQERRAREKRERQARMAKKGGYVFAFLIMCIILGVLFYSNDQEKKRFVPERTSTDKNRAAGQKRANPPATISVLASEESCFCGSHKGSFNAIYENRKIKVDFSYNPTKANPVDHPLTVRNNNKNIENWDALLCTSGNNTCPASGVKMNIYGRWKNDAIFEAYNISIEEKNLINWSMGKKKFDSTIKFMNVGDENSGTIVSINRCELGEGDRRICYNLVIRSSAGKLMQGNFWDGVNIYLKNNIIYSMDTIKKLSQADGGHAIYQQICRNLAPGNKVNAKLVATESDSHYITDIKITDLKNIGLCVEENVSDSTIDLAKKTVLLDKNNWDVRWVGVVKYQKAKPQRNVPLTMTLHREGDALEGSVQRSSENSKTAPISYEVRGTIKPDGSFILWDKGWLVWRGKIKEDNSIEGVQPNAEVHQDGSSIKPEFDLPIELKAAEVLAINTGRLKKEEGDKTVSDWVAFLSRFRSAVEKRDLVMLGNLMTYDFSFMSDANNKMQAIQMIQTHPEYYENLWEDLSKIISINKEKRPFRPSPWGQEIRILVDEHPCKPEVVKCRYQVNLDFRKDLAGQWHWAAMYFPGD